MFLSNDATLLTTTEHKFIFATWQDLFFARYIIVGSGVCDSPLGRRDFVKTTTSSTSGHISRRMD